VRNSWLMRDRTRYFGAVRPAPARARPRAAPIAPGRARRCPASVTSMEPTAASKADSACTTVTGAFRPRQLQLGHPCLRPERWRSARARHAGTLASASRQSSRVPGSSDLLPSSMRAAAWLASTMLPSSANFEHATGTGRTASRSGRAQPPPRHVPAPTPLLQLQFHGGGPAVRAAASTRRPGRPVALQRSSGSRRSAMAPQRRRAIGLRTRTFTDINHSDNLEGGPDCGSRSRPRLPGRLDARGLLLLDGNGTPPPRHAPHDVRPAARAWR